MPAKSFIGGMGHGVRNFYAQVLRGEVSDANVRGYLNAASQIADLWQQVDERIAQAISGGTMPWEAYAQYRYALAFVRAARTNQVIVQELLAANDAADPAAAGFLPHVTYDQANALCHQIQPNVQAAAAALADPTYAATQSLPLALAARVEAQGHVCPLPHLQGMIAAAREVHEWATGLLAEYQQAVDHATQPAPAEIATHLTALQRLLAEAESQLRFGEDLVGQVSQSSTTPELHEQAETQLWQALAALFLLNQVVAMPGWQGAPAPVAAAPRSTYHDQRIMPDDLWRVAAPSARAELRSTPFGADEMRELCAKMGNTLSANAQQYLDEVAAGEQAGTLVTIAAMANCPFEPLYRARTNLTLAGVQVPAGYEFHWDFHRNHIEMAPRFDRADDWQECAE